MSLIVGHFLVDSQWTSYYIIHYNNVFRFTYTFFLQQYNALSYCPILSMGTNILKHSSVTFLFSVKTPQNNNFLKFHQMK